MSDNILRYLIATAIALLLIYQIGTLITNLFSSVWGAVSAVVVAAVSLLSVRLARKGGKNSFWFLLPMLVFTFIPIALMIMRGLTESADWFDRLVMLTPYMVGFGVPMLLLLLVYYELRRRSTAD